MSKKKSGRDPQRFQKRMLAVVSIILVAALVLSLVAGLLAY